MDRDEIVDQGGHVLASAVGLAWIAAQPDSLLPYAFAGFWFRVVAEHAQHFEEDGWSWPILGGGRWIDIFWATAGGTLVGLLLT